VVHPEERGLHDARCGIGEQLVQIPAKNKKDFLSLNYDPSATKHVSSACGRVRIGCMDRTIPVLGCERMSKNFDETATVASTCLPELKGCLNPLALNYGCAYVQSTACNNSLVSTHDRWVCNFDLPPMPPSPPPPPLPPGRYYMETWVIEVEFIMAGDMASYIANDVETLLKDRLADGAQTTPDRVTIDATPSSIRIVATITTDSEADANRKAEALQEAIGYTLASASAFLGVECLSIPTITVKMVLVEVWAPPPPSQDIGLIIGPSVGAAALIILIIIYLIWRRRRKRPAANKTHPDDPDNDENFAIKETSLVARKAVTPPVMQEMIMVNLNSRGHNAVKKTRKGHNADDVQVIEMDSSDDDECSVEPAPAPKAIEGDAFSGLLQIGVHRVQAEDSLPDGWKQTKTKDGKWTYYFHTVTNETSWLRPVAKSAAVDEAVDT